MCIRDSVDTSNTLSYNAGTSLPSGLSLDSNTGLITGTLAADASVNSPYTVTITATDNAGASTTQQFTWTIANLAPTAVDNDANVQEDITLSAMGNIITDTVGADSDSDGDAITVTQVGTTAVAATGNTVINGSFGDLTIAADGSYTYDLTNASVQNLGATQQATETFAYTISDGQGGTATANLTIPVSYTHLTLPTTPYV